MDPSKPATDLAIGDVADRSLGDWKRTRSQIGNTLRYDPAADVTDLRRRLKAERLADHVREAIESAPPLTADQIETIRAIMRSVEAGDPHAAA